MIAARLFADPPRFVCRPAELADRLVSPAWSRYEEVPAIAGP